MPSTGQYGHSNGTRGVNDGGLGRYHSMEQARNVGDGIVFHTEKVDVGIAHDVAHATPNSLAA